VFDRIREELRTNPNGTLRDIHQTSRATGCSTRSILHRLTTCLARRAAARPYSFFGGRWINDCASHISRRHRGPAPVPDLHQPARSSTGGHRGVTRKHVEAHHDIAPKYEWTGRQGLPVKFPKGLSREGSGRKKIHGISCDGCHFSLRCPRAEDLPPIYGLLFSDCGSGDAGTSPGSRSPRHNADGGVAFHAGRANRASDMRWIHTPLPAAELQEVCQRPADQPHPGRVCVCPQQRPEGDCGCLRSSSAPGPGGFGRTPSCSSTWMPPWRVCGGRLSERETLVVLAITMSTASAARAFLVSVLRRFGLDPRFVVPRRLEEGYGLRSRGRSIAHWRPGSRTSSSPWTAATNSNDELAYLQAQGVDAIVIDHHRSKEKPTGRRHPGQSPCLPRAGRCARGAISARSGWCSSWCMALLKQLRAENHPVAFSDPSEGVLDLVAMGYRGRPCALGGREPHSRGVMVWRFCSTRVGGGCGRWMDRVRPQAPGRRSSQWTFPSPDRAAG